MITKSLKETVDQVLAFFAQSKKDTIRIATPLGLGKPNQLLNLIYQHCRADASRKLEIYTALSLDPPLPRSDVEQRFLQPFVDRIFGDDYPSLDYVRDLKKNALPEHIRIHEFYVEAGGYKNSERMQQDYASINYTQVVRNLVASEAEIILLLVSRRGDRYSLSSNPDLTLDLCDELKAAGRRFLVVGVVHPDLPFVGGDAEVSADFFQVILQSPEIHHKLFSVPRTAIDPVDFTIGLHASRIVPDAGTLQIGIGSLSDAIVYSLIQRHEKNQVYRRIMQELPGPGEFQLGVFDKGLYGTSEMVMDGFMHLRKAGILKRHVNHGEHANYLEGAFFLGSEVFYDWLRGLDEEDFSGFSMTRVSRVNQLFDRHDRSLRAERPNARFFNTCMNITLLGGAASETLIDGRVISGVGGQYNFVAMAHQLRDAHSVLMLRSTSLRDGKLQSNIVPEHGHLTIPRHLRDVVITEYGVAYLRGKTDGDVVRSLLEIADSRQHEALIKSAVDSRKLPPGYRVSERARQNTPERVKELIARCQQEYSLFPQYPFGSDFTSEEMRLGKALLQLKRSSLPEKLQFLFRGFRQDPRDFQVELRRMRLQAPETWREKILARLLMGTLD